MTLGQLLKSKRIEMGRSLEQVAASTKIHLKILSAIEEDHYAELPARTFTRGFIVNYAKALKLDTDQLMKDYHDFLEQKFNERPNRDQGHQGYAFEGKELEQNKRWMVVGASIAAIFAISVLLIFKPQNHKHKEKHKEFEDESAETSQPLDETSSATGTASSISTSTSVSVATTTVNSSSSPSAANGFEIPSQSPASSSLSTPPPKPSVTATATPAPTATSTPSPTPLATATPAVTTSPTPSESATASPSASVSPTPKPDKLNKGDALEPSEAKRKITFKAKDDVWVRYQSDDRPVGVIILRKDRLLVIKAKESIIFETNHPESLQYKIKSANYGTLGFSKGEVTPDANVKENTSKSLGGSPLPNDVPAPAGAH